MKLSIQIMHGVKNRDLLPNTSYPDKTPTLINYFWDYLEYDAHILDYYPNAKDWFYEKVVPGLDTDERALLVYMLDNAWAGIAICKRFPTEKKLCTLHVRGADSGLGIGSRLIERAFSWLGEYKPLFTVPEEELGYPMKQLLKTWGFPEPQACKEMYRQGKIEYVFNRAESIFNKRENLFFSE